MLFKHLLGLGLLTLIASCSQPTNTQTKANTTPYFVTLQNSNAVQQLPSEQRWDGLPTAHYVATNNNQTQLLVGSAQDPNVFLLDVASGELIAHFDVGPHPQGVGISPDGKWGLAVGSQAGTVTLIDMAQAKQEAVIAVGNDPHNVLFTPDSKLAYVTLQGEGAIAIIDLAAKGMVEKFALEGVAYPHNLDLSNNGNTLWVRTFDSKVAAVDLTSHQVKAIIEVGASHGGITVIPHSNWVAAAAIGSDSIAIIDAKKFEVARTIEVGQGSHGIRASADGRYLYTGVTGTHQIAVIDTSNWQVIEQVPVDGKNPFWLSISANH